MRKVIAEIIALLYVCLMLYTALNKLRDYDLSREQMAMMPLLTPIAAVVAWLLPITEIVIAVMLFFPTTRITGLKVVTALMVFFCLYITYMMLYHKELPCSCGGFLEILSWPQHLIFNGIFIALGLMALKFSRNKQTSRMELPFQIKQNV
jgi:uncharacterized membrane protein YphA (DoxX/SURF4 family)